jgi:putative Mg2+ transporter-C (MgtC) family protein
VEALFLHLGLPEALIESLHLGLLGRLLLAALLGGLLGLEREVNGKPAGLRTNLLICVGAALLMEISIRTAMLPGVVNPASGTVGDPTRIAAQIVSGIGFLGAGTIMQARGTVVGLTTAATIWVVAAIGMAVGARAYVEAVGSTVLVLLALISLGRLESLLIRRKRSQRYLFTLDPDSSLLLYVAETFRKAGLRVETESVEKGGEQYEAAFDVIGASRLHPRALEALIEHAGVRRVTRVL